jgi:tryptophan-rich sensory protein
MDLPRWAYSVLPVGIAAGLGGLAAKDAPEVYAGLTKPRWAPPASVFGPVWSILYLATGLAGWKLFRSGSRRTKTLHLVQLSLNTAWPAVFFGVRDKRSSLVIIALLDCALAAEVASLRHEDSAAASLLLPSLAWSAFATALNASVSDPGRHSA